MRNPSVSTWIDTKLAADNQPFNHTVSTTTNTTRKSMMNAKCVYPCIHQRINLISYRPYTSNSRVDLITWWTTLLPSPKWVNLKKASRTAITTWCYSKAICSSSIRSSRQVSVLGFSLNSRYLMQGLHRMLQNLPLKTGSQWRTYP